MLTRAMWPVAVAVVWVVAGAEAGAQRRAATNPGSALRQERAFAARVQDAVRAQDRAAVADLIRYPARVSVHLRPFPIYVADRSALLQMYDMVFTPQLRCAIAASREPSAGEPAPKDRLLLARGVVSMAGGRIVAERSGRGMLMTRLSSFGDMATLGGKPRQVTLDGPRRDIQLAGRMAESGVDTYVLAARPHETVQAKIDRVADGTLVLRVTRVSGDYRVEVVRRASYCEPPTIPYLLTLSLKP